jgi:hypothetical protein
MRTNYIRCLHLFIGMMLFIGMAQLHGQSVIEKEGRTSRDPIPPKDTRLIQEPRKALCVQFKEGVNPRLRIGDGGTALTCIPAVDSINRLYGCSSVEKRFRLTYLKADDPHNQDYYFRYRTGIDVNALRQAYLSTGVFAYILNEDEMWLGEDPGWSGRVRDTEGSPVVGNKQASIALRNVNDKALYVKFKPGIALAVRQGAEVAYTGNALLDSLNERFGCIGIEKVFKGKTPKSDYDADRSYILRFKGGSDVYEARKQYLAKGAFQSIFIAKYLPVTGGTMGFVPNDPRYPKQWALNNDSFTFNYFAR